jgi:hypothetical protein
VHVEWRFPLDFAPSPLVFHLIPFRESLIHQTLSVITHQTEKKQPCESLSLSLWAYIYILGPYAGCICIGRKARGSLNAHLGYFVNKPPPLARYIAAGDFYRPSYYCTFLIRFFISWWIFCFFLLFSLLLTSSFMADCWWSCAASPSCPTDSRLGPADPLRPGARLGIVRMPTVDPSAQQPLRRVGRRRWVDSSSHFPYILYSFVSIMAISLSPMFCCLVHLFCGTGEIIGRRGTKMKEPENKRRTMGGKQCKKISKTKWMAQSFPGGKTPLRHITIL